ANGPFAVQLITMRSQLEALGEQITRLRLDVVAAQQATGATYQVWQDAADRANEAQRRADDAAREAYKRATGLGPLDGYANDLRQLGQLAPGLDPDPESDSTESLIVDAPKAAQIEVAAWEAYQSARLTEQRLTSQQATLLAQHAQQTQ